MYLITAGYIEKKVGFMNFVSQFRPEAAELTNSLSGKLNVSESQHLINAWSWGIMGVGLMVFAQRERVADAIMRHMYSSIQNKG